MNIANINYNDSSQCQKQKKIMDTGEVKNIQIKVRISETDKEIIDEYCAANEMTLSNFLRAAIAEYLNK